MLPWNDQTRYRTDKEKDRDPCPHLSHEHTQRYHEQVAQGRRLVSVTVTTDAEDEEARSLMVDIGADEISSAADGTMHVVHRAPPPGAVPPNA